MTAHRLTARWPRFYHEGGTNEREEQSIHRDRCGVSVLLHAGGDRGRGPEPGRAPRGCEAVRRRGPEQAELQRVHPGPVRA